MTLGTRYMLINYAVDRNSVRWLFERNKFKTNVFILTSEQY